MNAAPMAPQAHPAVSAPKPAKKGPPILGVLAGGLSIASSAFLFLIVGMEGRSAGEVALVAAGAALFFASISALSAVVGLVRKAWFPSFALGGMSVASVGLVVLTFVMDAYKNEIVAFLQ